MKTIDIFGVIGEEWDGLTSRDIAKQLEGLEPGKDELFVRINSPGGFAHEGISIYNLLKPFEPTVLVTSLAASAASIAMCSGKQRLMATGARAMIHKAWTIDMGDGDYFIKRGGELNHLDESLADIYAEAGMDRAAAFEAMRATTYYSAEEAVAVGLATSVDRIAADEEPENTAIVLNAMGCVIGDISKEQEKAAEQLKFEAKRRRAKSLLERHRKGLKSVSIPK